MKILICGSREDFDEARAKEYLTEFIEKYKQEQFIHGGARGIDSMADEILRGHKIIPKVVRPDYNRYGYYAPIQRDREMVDETDLIVAFWNLRSNGTKFTINYAKSLKKKVEVFNISPSGRLGV